MNSKINIKTNFQIGISCNINDIDTYLNIFSIFQLHLGDLSKPEYPELNNDIITKLKNKETKSDFFIHSKICFNISKENINFAIKKEVNFLKSINQKTGIVIHLSKFYITDRFEALLDVCNKLNILFDKYVQDENISLILETSYNFKHLGSRIEDFEVIFNNINPKFKERLGICLDTSHLFLSGYVINDLSYLIEYFTLFHMKIGLDKIKLIHLNDIDSKYFGKHTQHLSILNDSGKIFSNKEILNFFISFAFIYNIPIILERKNNIIEHINEEIKEIYSFIDPELNIINKNTLREENINLILRNKLEFDIFIKVNIILNFLNTLIDFYNVTEFDNNIKTEELTNIKKKIISIFNNEPDEGIIEINSKFKFTFQDNYYLVKDDIDKILNNYSYSIFKKYLEDSNYKTISELMSIKFIGPETIKNLITHNIRSIEDLKARVKTQKNLLTQQQKQALTNYKFIRPLMFSNAELIIEQITTNFKSYIYHILGSYYRIKNTKEEDQKIINKLIIQPKQQQLIKDIDLLFVMEDSNTQILETFLNKITTIFSVKAILLNGNRRKSYLLKTEIKKKNIFFVLEIYICNKLEEPFMILYLKGPTEKNMKMYKIAQHKGYKMSSTGLYDINKKENIYFESDKDILAFLGMT